MKVRFLGFLALAACGFEWSIGLLWASEPASPVIRDFRYGEDAAQALDIYSPRAGARRPVLFAVHGGGWLRGDKADMSRLASELGRSLGYVVVCPNYRLSKEEGNRFPVPAADAARALSWTQRNIQNYGGDPERIFVLGKSAGAHLSALLAYAPRQQWLRGSSLSPVDLRPVRGFIGISGAYDFSLVPETRWQVKTFLKGNYGPGRWELASPVTYVSRSGPPALILTGDSDCFANKRDAAGRCDGQTNNSVRLTAALDRAGIPAKLVVVSGCGHRVLGCGGVTPGRFTRLIAEFVEGARPL